MEKTKTRSAKKITDTVKKIVGMAEAKPVTAKKPASKSSVSKDELARRIQEKAYELYVKRGGCHGDDQNDWYEAERLVRSEMGRS
ncbi:MAG: DUF2934 domain-containing protein [Candidatus Omnitrophica bacterium]|nr:DUF2934 domain-containing protein [Candidatus Omnitrophota bacterium]